jgi:hypothetical protein
MTPIIAFSTYAGAIDADAGIIRGVSLITEGPALGHGVMVDAKTIEQVKSSAQGYSGGLKVKLDHGSGAGDIVGYIQNLRVDGKKLLGDLHLLENSPHRAYILEIATKIPDTFGLSIAFSGPSELSADKKTVLQRCSEIYSVDIVDSPAANPDGFFSRKMKQLQAATETETETETESPEIEIELPMNEELKKAIGGMIESAMMSYGDRLSKLEASLAPKPEDKQPPAAQMSSKSEAVELAAKEAALAAVKEFAKTIGAPATPVVTAEAAQPAKNEHKFEEIVTAKAAELKGDKAGAITFAIKNHPTEYAAYRSRVMSGEKINL